MENKNKNKNEYRPQLGWTVSYPFNWGTAQNGEREDQRIEVVHGDWAKIETVANYDQVRWICGGQKVPDNKTATVVQISYTGVEAIYNHDGRFTVIRYSHRNVPRLIGALGVVHTILKEDSAEPKMVVRAWETKGDALSAAKCVRPMVEECELDVPILTPVEVPPSQARYSNSSERVFVPRFQVLVKGIRVEGEIVFNQCGEPVGVLKGKQVVCFWGQENL